jgi:hypothetical protein
LQKLTNLVTLKFYRMAKDPAFLFYPSDFLTGVQDLTHEERGQYITLLCVQHQKGPLTLKQIKIIAPGVTKDVIKKFTQDGDLYYNERLELEREKRQKHSQKQREKALKRWNKIPENNTAANATAEPRDMPQHKKTMPGDMPQHTETNTAGYAAGMPLENKNVNRDINRDNKRIDAIDVKRNDDSKRTDDVNPNLITLCYNETKELFLQFYKHKTGVDY